jgi:hypothetical protein
MMNRRRHLVHILSPLLLACIGCQPQTSDVETANKEVVPAEQET